MADRIIGRGFVRVSPEKDDGSRFAREAGPGMRKAGHQVGKTFGTSFAGAFVAVGAATAIAGFVRGAVEAAEQAERVNRLTEAVLKSTGEGAHVTAEHLIKLTEKLSKVVAVNDDVIQSAGNVLLTFTKVRQEVGKGNDVFDQALVAALNLSAALGTDLQAATILVGKALNDPISGLTALRKAGIQFTEQQKEQIRTMVESGRFMDAQKIVLKELEVQFGGAGAAAASSADKARVAWQEFQEQLGHQVLPIVEDILHFGLENQRWLTPLVVSLGQMAVVLGTSLVLTKAWTLAQTAMGVGLTGMAAKARRAAVGLAAYLIVVQAINSAGKDLNPQIEELGERLVQFSETGQVAGELARVMGDNMDKLTLAFRNASSGGAGFAADIENWIPGAKAADASWTKNIERIHALDQALAELTSGGRLEEAGAAYLKLWEAAEKVGLSVEQFKALFPGYNAALDKATRHIFDVGSATEAAAASGEDLLKVWNELAGIMLTADQAMLEAKDAIKEIAETFEDGSKSVKGNSRAALENRIALEEASKAATEAAAAYLANGGSAAGAERLLRQFRDEAVRATGATGKQADEVRRLADELFGIPNNVTATVNIRIAETVTSIVAKITSRVQAQLRAFGFADGGIFSYASGGVEQHIAQIGQPGAIRIWNEPEAGPEAYIPLAAAKRSRSTAILAEVAHRFGYGLADPAAGAGGGMQIQNVNVTALTGSFSLAQLQDDLAFHAVH